MMIHHLCFSGWLTTTLSLQPSSSSSPAEKKSWSNIFLSFFTGEPTPHPFALHIFNQSLQMCFVLFCLMQHPIIRFSDWSWLDKVKGSCKQDFSDKRFWRQKVKCGANISGTGAVFGAKHGQPEADPGSDWREKTWWWARCQVEHFKGFVLPPLNLYFIGRLNDIIKDIGLMTLVMRVSW